MQKWTAADADDEEPELEYQEEATYTSNTAPDESKEVPLDLFFSPDKVDELKEALN